jgi:peroxiredoxin (alkyl hydroperoxide reductase subunit C)
MMPRPEEEPMLSVGDRFPEFRLKSVVSVEAGQEFTDVTHQSYPGKWKVVFFWPMDFSLVCPTEIVEFGRRGAEFEAKGAQLLGASIDTHYVHLAWRRENPALRDLPFPMMADTKRELAAALGILNKDGVAYRATFIVDAEGTIRSASANENRVGRSVGESLRMLDALQTGEACPVEWTKGQPTLKR